MVTSLITLASQPTSFNSQFSVSKMALPSKMTCLRSHQPASDDGVVLGPVCPWRCRQILRPHARVRRLSDVRHPASSRARGSGFHFLLLR